jgi:hypothetical protein
VFAGKAGAYPSEITFRCSTLGKAPGLAHKDSAGKASHGKTLAFYENSLITAVKSFITLAPCLSY